MSKSKRAPQSKRFLTEAELDSLTAFIKPNPYIPIDTADSLAVKTKSVLLEQLKTLQLYPSVIPKLRAELEKQYSDTLIQPGECVGVITAQCIGERQTQANLNSILGAEQICVKYGDKVKIVKIGEWIDSLMAENQAKIVWHGKTEELVLEEHVEVPTVDKYGKMHWKRIEGITRHPPLDKNGAIDNLLYVKTASGRAVTATKHKSFLVRENNLIVGKEGAELKLGDRLPITIQFPKPDKELNYINLSDYLSKKEYIYGTELEKAVQYRDLYKAMPKKEFLAVNYPSGKERVKGSKMTKWWLCHHEIDFTLPFHRPDSAISQYNLNKYNSGFVYTYRGSHSISKFPEQIPLDNDFGFFIGAYLAEGHLLNTNTQISIANYDDKFRARIATFCDRYSIGYHTVRTTENSIQWRKEYNAKKNITVNDSSKAGDPIDIRVHSTLLVELINKLCGRRSEGKFVPAIAINSNLDFVRGILDGYFCGDGCVNYTHNIITCTSASEPLIDGINLLLNRFGIFAHKLHYILKSNNLKTKNIRPVHGLSIRNSNVRMFAKEIPLTIEIKNTKLQKLSERNFPYIHGSNDIIPGIKLSDRENFNYHRDYLQNIPVSTIEDAQILKNAKESEVYFDTVKEIKEVPPPEHVYDLTVAETRFFNLYNGLVLNDTFHRAGSSDKVPTVSKFSELLNATNKPKVPSYYIYFNQGNDTLQNLRETMGHSIVQITLKQVVKESTIELDKEPEPWYPAFDTFNEERGDNFTDCLSVKVDMDLLYEYRLTMRDITDRIESTYSDIRCVYSPDCIGQLDIYVDSSDITLPEKTLHYITEENTKEIYLEEVVQPMLENFVVCGIPGVIDRYFLQEKREVRSAHDNSDAVEWFVETLNSREKPIKTFRMSKEKPLDSVKRFKTVLANPIVEMSKTASNNAWDILHTFGIEATRQYMINEFSSIMEGINTCHVMLLVDKMTYGGSISSISRYTMRRDDSGVLSRASFEETLDNLLCAGVFGQDEPMKGVSASIICGKVARIGTGMCDLSVNLEKLGVVEEENEEEESSESERSESESD